MYWRNQLIVLYNTSCRWSNRALKKLDYPHNSNQWRSPEAVVPIVVPKNSIHVHHPKSIVQAIPINRQPVKTIFRTIPTNRQSPRSFVWKNPINWKHQTTIVQAIPSNRQLMKTIFWTIPCDSLRDHLSGKLRLIESTRHQLFRQFQLMDSLWKQFSRQFQLIRQSPRSFVWTIPNNWN